MYYISYLIWNQEWEFLESLDIESVDVNYIAEST